MNGKSGYVDVARRLLNAMPKPNFVSWNSIVMVLVQNSVFNEALEVFKAMRRTDVKPHQAIRSKVVGYWCRREFAEGTVRYRPFSSVELCKAIKHICCCWSVDLCFKGKGYNMKERDVARTPGCSLIEQRNKTHRFLVGDRFHPEIMRIYLKLEQLFRKIQKFGYKPETEFVLHNVEDDAKEDMIKEHLQKFVSGFLDEILINKTDLIEI